MSKINELIKEMCPNGMNFKSIDSVADLYYGKGNNIPKDGGDYPVYGCYGIVSSTSTFNNEDTPIVGHIGSAGKVSWGDGKHYVTYNGTICKPKNKNELNSRYLYHVLLDLHLENYVKGSQPFLSSSDFGPIKIAIPPLEIQEEIVKILDKFGELETELETELEARKSQYEFWRGNIFSSNGNIVKLDDVCNITAGGTPSKTHSEYWTDGNIKWLGSTVCENKKSITEVTNYITELGLNKSSAKLLKPGTTLIAMVGATIGKVAFLDFEACTNQNVAGLYPKNINELDTSYLYHACRNLYSTFLNYANGKFSMASLGYIKNLEIPLPDINNQKRIAKLLDKFDKLINDISEGLPAEIELRRKQYEYYRNKLLNFEDIQYE